MRCQEIEICRPSGLPSPPACRHQRPIRAGRMMCGPTTSNSTDHPAQCAAISPAVSSCVVRSCRQPRQICMSRTLKSLHSAPAKNNFRALSD
jgi:hypothetical protein